MTNHITLHPEMRSDLKERIEKLIEELVFLTEEFGDNCTLKEDHPNYFGFQFFFNYHNGTQNNTRIIGAMLPNDAINIHLHRLIQLREEMGSELYELMLNMSRVSAQEAGSND